MLVFCLYTLVKKKHKSNVKIRWRINVIAEKVEFFTTLGFFERESYYNDRHRDGIAMSLEASSAPDLLESCTSRMKYIPLKYRLLDVAKNTSPVHDPPMHARPLVELLLRECEL